MQLVEMTIKYRDHVSGQMFHGDKVSEMPLFALKGHIVTGSSHAC